MTQVEQARPRDIVGNVGRTIQLPPGATEADVEATYRDGVLDVRIPIDRTEAAADKVAIIRS